METISQDAVSPQTTRSKRICNICGREFSALILTVLGHQIPAGVCVDCDDAEKARNSGGSVASRAIPDVPADYREFDLERLPAKRIYPRVMAWQYGARGLGLIGDSWLGKTRLIWELLKREMRAGRDVVAMSATEFGLEVQERSGNHTLPGWIRRLCDTGILFLDDLGKERLTDTVEAQLYHVINQRQKFQRPIFFTANATGETLSKKMSDDRGTPIINRLRYMCESITVTK